MIYVLVGLERNIKSVMERIANTVIKSRSAGGVVINTKGEILIVSQKGTSWSLPKGHIEDGENKLEAAKREIYEESGIKDLELILDLGSYTRYRMDKDGKNIEEELKEISLFLFKTKEQNLRPVDPENPEQHSKCLLLQKNLTNCHMTKLFLAKKHHQIYLSHVTN